MRALTLRLLHGYVGALIAPSVLFFAMTGAVQILGLHEAHGDYRPPALLAQLGSIHKDQRLLKPRPPEPASGAPDTQVGATAAPEPAPPNAGGGKLSLSTIGLKLYFLIVAIGLVTSTVTGVWVGFTRPRGRSLLLGLLAAGCILPVLIFLL